jgi:signal transduction histidine kinase
MIFDPAGRLAGSDPVMSPNGAPGDPASLAFFLQKIQINVSASQQVIQAAFANKQNLADLVSTQLDGQTLAAVPILDRRSGVSGVLLVAVRGLYNDPHASGSVLRTIFGVITARRITRRLQRMTEAAHAWSVGDFQAHVSDHSSDELGQLAQDLNRMALQVQNLLDARQQLASLEERQRVARDLHDSVKQQAFALTLLIGAAQARLPADPAAAQGQLYKASDLADQIRQELTAILQQLRPVALAGQELQEALRTYTHQWSRASGIACEFPASGLPGESGMPVLRPEIEEALFRIAQEALANAARHS